MMQRSSVCWSSSVHQELGIIRDDSAISSFVFVEGVPRLLHPSTVELSHGLLEIWFISTLPSSFVPFVLRDLLQSLWIGAVIESWLEQ